MHTSDLLIKGALALYRGVAKSGFLQSSVGSRIFTTSYFSYKRLVEDPFQKLVNLRPELFKSGNILDIGANIGYTASVFAQVVEPKFKVYCFEPEDNNFKMLNASMQRLKLVDRVVCEKLAVGSKSEVLEIFVNKEHHADHRILTPEYEQVVSTNADKSKVKVTSVDDYVANHLANQPITFIKIDVQGFEYPVWQGMKKTIVLNPELVMAIEYAPVHMQELGYNPKQLIEEISSAGFNLYQLASSGEVKKILIGDFENCSGGRGYFDFIATKRDLMA